MLRAASRWGMVAVLAFMLVATPGTPAAASAGGQTGIKYVASGDRAATLVLLKAEYELTKATVDDIPAVDAALTQAANALGHECRGALRGAPDESAIGESGPPASKPRLSGRAQGEHARSELEWQMISLEIGDTLSVTAGRVLRGPYDAFIATADRLTWNDPTIDALVHQKVARLREDLIGPPVAVCAEMRAWAASGFHVLPPRIRRLDEARETRGKQTVDGNLEVLLQPYEDAADRTIARRITALKEQLRERQRTDERLLRAIHQMKLALGEKVPRFEEQLYPRVIAKVRTHAGTTFVIRANAGKSSPGSCVEVEVNERDGGSSSEVCLSERARSHPSGSCSGRPVVETIRLATPPDVRRARVRLSDGRTVTVAVVHVSAKDGGPAGVFVDAFRGHNHYPVVVQELSRDGRVLRTVDVRGMRCVKESAGGGPGALRIVKLATVTSPSGEPLIIEGTLQGAREEFFLVPPEGAHNSRAGEEHQTPKQFQWNLSTECAPHPYSLLDGILLPPGASVLVRTPAGLTPLTKIELAASMHAGGPLFYGVYTTPPTEIVVEGSDGSILYTESLAAKATEETEFCEGYAEHA
jgi:hypothetical protein